MRAVIYAKSSKIVICVCIPVLFMKLPVDFFFFLFPPKGGALFLEVLQYQVDAWSGWSKLLFQLLIPTIRLIYCPQIEDVSDIKLIRTDTTLDLSQKAEK